MAKKKGGKKPKPLTLKAVQKCVDLTLDGRRRLDLSYKGLTTVPACAQRVMDIGELNLSRNLLKKLPPFIEHFDNATVLDLHSNYLDEIPQTIKSLTGLTVLNLCNNRLTSLPIEIGKLSNLHILNLGLNLLKALPNSIGHLKELRYLGLSYNHFVVVPTCIGKLKKLEKVNLEGNPIKYPEVPGVKKWSKSDRFHVVKESLLCRNCLETFQIEREKLNSAEKRPDFETSSSIKSHVVMAKEKQNFWLWAGFCYLGFTMFSSLCLLSLSTVPGSDNT
uniref:Disease resistance R13L4/SHOC-2-like LRR domain-containing protein n=1 Tax=Poecilia mexicana TaxID=48701 RepID=A0A3B3X9H4_9TELE